MAFTAVFTKVVPDHSDQGRLRLRYEPGVGQRHFYIRGWSEESLDRLVGVPFVAQEHCLLVNGERFADRDSWGIKLVPDWEMLADASPKFMLAPGSKRSEVDQDQADAQAEDLPVSEVAADDQPDPAPEGGEA